MRGPECKMDEAAEAHLTWTDVSLPVGPVLCHVGRGWEGDSLAVAAAVLTIGSQCSACWRRAGQLCAGLAKRGLSTRQVQVNDRREELKSGGGVVDEGFAGGGERARDVSSSGSSLSLGSRARVCVLVVWNQAQS